MTGAVDPGDVGSVIADKYVVERLLGKGGMGLVVAATHRDLGELRAIKLLKPGLLQSGDLAQRFLHEARASARLRSPYVVKVYDVGKLDNGAPFMVMEHLEGRDLAAVRSEHGVLPVSDVALYAIQICDVLAEAHALGLVHRDLKPANLLLTRDGNDAPCVKVLDFGISKSISPDEHTDEMTTSGKIMGTPVYMPPEQMRGARDLDARADIWALGVILYVLLTGRYPFDGAGAMAVMTRVLETTEPPSPPSSIRDAIPPALGAVILRCMEREREKRFANAADLARALLPFAPDSARALMPRIIRCAEGRLSLLPVPQHDVFAFEPSSARPRDRAYAQEKETVPEGMARRLRNRRGIAGILLLALASLAGLGALLVMLPYLLHRGDDIVSTAPMVAAASPSILGASSPVPSMPEPANAASVAASAAASVAPVAPATSSSSAAATVSRPLRPEGHPPPVPRTDKPNRHHF